MVTVFLLVNIKSQMCLHILDDKHAFNDIKNMYFHEFYNNNSELKKKKKKNTRNLRDQFTSI